jgi:hypothetical protein
MTSPFPSDLPRSLGYRTAGDDSPAVSVVAYEQLEHRRFYRLLENDTELGRPAESALSPRLG